MHDAEGPVGNLVDKGSVKNPLFKKLVAGFDATILSYARRSRPKSILDAGCGEGRLSRMLASALSAPVKAVDHSPDLIAANQRRAGGGGIRNIWSHMELRAYLTCPKPMMQPIWSFVARYWNMCASLQKL